MKKLMTLILVMLLAAVFLAAGCATVKDWFCSNRVVIENAIATARNTINTIQATFPEFIPPEYQVVIATATAVITQGEALLANNFCPTAADVEEIQTQQGNMSKALRSAGITTEKVLRK